MFWHRWGYINTIHCCCFWVLQKKKQENRVRIYFHLFFILCILFVCFCCSTESFMHSQTLFSFLLITVYCIVHFIVCFWYNGCTTSKKKCWENMVSMYITCYVHFYIILYQQLITILLLYLLLFIVVGVWE